MGKPAPTIYDPMCSVYVLESGEAMLRAHQAQAAEDGRPTPVMYLSTTDFVQHKYEPEEPEALDFYSGVDAAIGALDSKFEYGDQLAEVAFGDVDAHVRREALTAMKAYE